MPANPMNHSYSPVTVPADVDAVLGATSRAALHRYREAVALHEAASSELSAAMRALPAQPYDETSAMRDRVATARAALRDANTAALAAEEALLAALALDENARAKAQAAVDHAALKAEERLDSARAAMAAVADKTALSRWLHDPLRGAPAPWIDDHLDGVRSLLTKVREQSGLEAAADPSSAT